MTTATDTGRGAPIFLHIGAMGAHRGISVVAIQASIGHSGRVGEAVGHQSSTPSASVVGVPESIWNSAQCPLVVFVAAVWIALAVIRPVAWFVLAPWMVFVSLYLPLKLTVQGDELVVTYALRRRYLSLNEIKTVRVRRQDGMARVARVGGGLWFCTVWSPLKITAFTESLASRGVCVERDVMLLGDWWS